MSHWLDKAPNADAKHNFEARTIGLADKLKSHVQNHQSGDEGYLGTDSAKVDEATEYLKKHPEILIYGFNKNGYLNKIVVSPKWNSLLKDSINRKCTMSSDIVKILQKYMNNTSHDGMTNNILLTL